MTAIELAKNGIRISERVGNKENLRVWKEILNALELYGSTNTCVGCVNKDSKCHECKRGCIDWYEEEIDGIRFM